MNFLGKFLPYLIILILSFLAFKPLLSPGFFPIHDDTQVARVYEMTKALKDGMFPVRWSQDLGYGFGYPIFNFYNPFPYYLASFFGILGADALLSTKLMVILGIIFSFISMYILAKEFWGRWGGILSASLYGLAPYHAVDLYVRGDFAESWAYSFIPLIFYGLWKIYKENKWKYVILTAFSFAFTISSHNLTALMVSPFILAFAIYLFRKRKVIFLPASLIVGALVAAFYWIPAILEMNYTNVLSQIGGGADFRDHFVCFSQLWASPWGYGGSAKGCIDGISFMIGKYHIVLSAALFIASLIFLLSKKYKKYKEKLLVIIFLYIGFLVSIFLTLDISRYLWERVEIMEFFQYPWRFLIMIVFFSSFIAGALPWFLGKAVNKKWEHVLTISLIIFIVFSSLKFFNPQAVLNKTSYDYTNLYSLKWETSRISDEYMPKNFKEPTNYSEISSFSALNSQNLQIKNFSQKTQELTFDLNIKKNMSQVFPIAYFPSWKGYLDDKNIEIYEDRKGIRIDLPKGDYSLKLIFKQTNTEVFANLITLLTIMTLLGYNALKKKHE